MKIQRVNISESKVQQKDILTRNNSLLTDWKWRREEIDTEIGYFYDIAWEADPFTGRGNGRKFYFVLLNG